ncbi:hypothetical protein [Acinetobacter baumannii]|uniref:hypothetical protein n=1 Tax=Acinetobacter baumannii TaxID=470 RepID=UPI0037BEAB33
MKPEQFIREFGVDKAREVVEGAPEGTTHIHSVTWQNYKQGGNNNYVWGRSDQAGWYLSIYDTLNGMMILEDLKRLVESVDRVNEHGGYLAAKELLSFLIVHQGAFGKSAVSDETINSLKAAILDHESIYGGGE